MYRYGPDPQLEPHSSYFLFRLIMQVTNVNDVRVYNLTCGQKAVPEVN